jgi:small-conductance mechanosensitive channel
MIADQPKYWIGSRRATCSAGQTQRLLWSVFTLVTLTIGAVAHAQPAKVSAPAGVTNPAPAPTETAVPNAIPLAEVATEAESVSARLREMQADLSSGRTREAAEKLPALTREIDLQRGDSANIIAQRPSLEMLDNLETDWHPLRRNLAGWTRDLTTRVSQLEKQIAQLDELDKTWQLTFNAARNSHAPPDLLNRIQSVIAAIKQTHAAFDKQRAQTLTLQNRVAEQDVRIAEALTSISNARENVFNRLFVNDGPPIWSPEARPRAARDLEEESRSSLSFQWTALRAYAERQTISFFVHAVVFGILAAGLYWFRRRVRQQLANKTEAACTLVFEMPVAAALILSLACSRWIYPEAPRLLWTAFGALALIPSAILLRHLIERHLYPVLYALVVFYFVDQMRTLTAAVHLLPRQLFLAEMLGAVLFLVWLIRSLDQAADVTPKAVRLYKIIKAGASVGWAVSALALIANATGYVTLANFLGNALLGSAYLALVLYAMVEVLDGLVMVALRLRPLAFLGIVCRHQALLRRRFRRGLQFLAVLLWILGTLQRLLLRDRLLKAVGEMLTAELTVGSLNLSLGDVLAFGATVWAAFLVSRFVRFLLDEEVYPRVHLDRGLPYAISTLVNYMILVIGLLVAVAALGFDMTKITILAGAFSVGVGLGLQNIFNNFVSGLILLFERPVNVGDVVQIDDASGVVERIGIRASIIRTTDGSEIIVPNAKLISERLINWTLSRRQRSIEVPVAVAQDSDPNRVIKLLERTAAAHPLVTDDPPPQALVVKLGADALGLELRAWTDRIEQWMQIRSELAITISATLTAEKIAIR